MIFKFDCVCACVCVMGVDLEIGTCTRDKHFGDSLEYLLILNARANIEWGVFFTVMNDE